MSTDESVSFSLEVNVEKTYVTTRKLLTLLFRVFGLLRRLGLPENLERGIATFQRFIMVVNQARLSVAALQAATGPVGWAMLGVSLATTALATGDVMNELTSG